LLFGGDDEEVDLDSLKLAHTLVQAIEDKKGEKILLLDISHQSTFADYFVIANGTSERQLKALAEAVSVVADQVVKRRQIMKRIDDQAEGGWILVDLGDVIVHLFSSEQRKHYNLEQLWQEGKILLRVQ
jgi:ribosome-associated protein